jgi:hypothetical protein
VDLRESAPKLIEKKMAKPATRVYFRDGCDELAMRPHFWGNPYVIGVHGRRKEVIEMFDRLMKNSPERRAKLHELQGKRIGCICKPHQSCHVDVILKWMQMAGYEVS